MDSCEYAFNLFEPRKERSAKNNNKPVVEIRPNGRIVFNKIASQLLTNNHYCMLGYDSQRKTIGLLPIEDQKTNAFPVRYAAKGAYVGAKRFFKHFDILPSDLVENTPFIAGEFISITM